jgi:adenine phosphoribosyltransferase
MVEDLQTRLLDAYRAPAGWYDPSMWWREPRLRRDLVAALAELHSGLEADAVVGTESRGAMLGAMVAERLGVGFIEARKNEHPDHVGEAVLRRTTPPDYNHRSIVIAIRKHAIRNRERILFIDDWIETGGQATAVRNIVEDAGADWVGAAVIVDATSAATRRTLNVRGILREAQLPSAD